MIALAISIVEKEAWSVLPLLVFPGFLVAWVWWLAFQAKRDEPEQGRGTSA